MTNIFVGNLSYQTTSEELQAAFAQFGSELDAATQALAAKLAAKPPAQLAAGKRGFYQQMDLGLEKAYELAGRIIAESFVHEEGRAGMDAFIEKRPPPKH